MERAEIADADDGGMQPLHGRIRCSQVRFEYMRRVRRVDGRRLIVLDRPD
jgi:hypothetical protein